jgi:uncharacterized protein YbjT (DUF2867 family)
MSTLLIAGATGLVGSHALSLALADARVGHVIALTRRPIAPHPKQRNVMIDFANLPADAAWWKVDGVISALGTTRTSNPLPSTYRAIDRDYPLALARHTRACGATRFAIVSTLGANSNSRFTYTRTKGELEVELGTLRFPSLTIVRPSVLDGAREIDRFDERMALAFFKFLKPVLPSRMKPSPAGAIAALLIEGAVAAAPGVHFKTNEDIRVLKSQSVA